MSGLHYDETKLSDYERGWLAALWLYAWVKDGTMYVGTTGRTYESAIRDFLQENNPEALL